MDASKKTILVTGSTDGVGKEVATRLAWQGARVLLHGRSEEKGAQVKREIERATGSNRLAYYNADFASLEEVRRLGETLARDLETLGVLIGNAGIGIADGARQESADGHELRFQMNYLAHFLLTHRLLDLLKASGPARIVNVSSAGQAAIDFGDVMLEENYSGVQAYCQSKLAQIMFTFDLAEQLGGSGVAATALHPATYMDTKIVDDPVSTVDDGAKAIMNLAVGDAAEGVTGAYYNQMREARAEAQAYERGGAPKAARAEQGAYGRRRVKAARARSHTVQIPTLTER